MLDHRIRALVSLITLVLPCGLAPAADLNVPSGSYPTIQSAIDAASDGDTVIVAPGVYVETIDFLGKGIVVRSTFGPRATLIDSNNTGTVVTFADDEGSDSVLEGFTVRGAGQIGEFNGDHGLLIDGSAPTIRSCIVTDNFWAGEGAGGGGGGMLVTNGGAPTILTSRFDANQAGSDFGNGGAVLSVASSPRFIDCIFAANTVNAGCFALGGAMFVEGGSATVTRSRFIFNEATASICVGISLARGGALATEDAVLEVRHSTFVGNETSSTAVEFCNESVGGGVSIGEGTVATIDDVDIRNNRALVGPLECDGAGGGLFNNGTLDLNNSYVCSNEPDGLRGSPPSGENNVFEEFCAGDPCHADINRDGVVNILDMIEILAAWGTPGVADLVPLPTGNGAVDINDLLLVLTRWGACP